MEVTVDLLDFIPPTHEFGAHPHELAKHPHIHSILSSDDGFNGEFYEIQELAGRIVPYFPAMLIMYQPGSGKTGAYLSCLNALMNTRRTEYTIIITREKVQNDLFRDMWRFLAFDARVFANKDKEYVQQRAKNFPKIKIMTYKEFTNTYASRDAATQLRNKMIIIDEPQNLISELEKVDNVDLTVLSILADAQAIPQCGITVIAVTNTPMVDSVCDLRVLGRMLLAQFYQGREYDLRLLIEGSPIDLAKAIARYVPIMWKESPFNADYNVQLSGIQTNIRYGDRCIDDEMFLIEMSPEQERQYIATVERGNSDFRGTQRRLALRCAEPQIFDPTVRSLAEWSPIMNYILKNENRAFEEREIGLGFVYFADIMERGAEAFAIVLEKMGWTNLSDAEGARKHMGSIDQNIAKTPDSVMTPSRTFALFTGTTGSDQTFNGVKSERNVYGAYIRLIIATKAYGEGVSFPHVTRIYKAASEWNRTRELQSDARTMRVTSHKLIRQMLNEPRYMEEHPQDKKYLDANGDVRPFLWRFCSYSPRIRTVDTDMWVQRIRKDSEIQSVYQVLTDSAFDKVVAEHAAKTKFPLSRMQAAARNYTRNNVGAGVQHWNALEVAKGDRAFCDLLLHEANDTWHYWCTPNTPNGDCMLFLPYQITGFDVRTMDPVIPAPVTPAQAGFLVAPLADITYTSDDALFNTTHGTRANYRSAILRTIEAGTSPLVDEIDVRVTYRLIPYWTIVKVSNRGVPASSVMFTGELIRDMLQLPMIRNDLTNTRYGYYDDALIDITRIDIPVVERKSPYLSTEAMRAVILDHFNAYKTI